MTNSLNQPNKRSRLAITPEQFRRRNRIARTVATLLLGTGIGVGGTIAAQHIEGGPKIQATVEFGQGSNFVAAASAVEQFEGDNNPSAGTTDQLVEDLESSYVQTYPDASYMEDPMTGESIPVVVPESKVEISIPEGAYPVTTTETIDSATFKISVAPHQK